MGPNVKPHSITTSKLETSDTESPPKKCKRESELDQKINAAIEENSKLSECLSSFDPKTITDTVINKEIIQVVSQLVSPQNNSNHRKTTTRSWYGWFIKTRNRL